MGRAFVRAYREDRSTKLQVLTLSTEEDQMRRLYSVLPRCLLMLGICSIFSGIGLSFAADDKDEPDIVK